MADHSEDNSLEDSQISTASTSNNTSIRSNRRRGKGVVLNTDRIKKYITSSTNSIDEEELSNNSMHISMLSNDNSNSNTTGEGDTTAEADTSQPRAGKSSVEQRRAVQSNAESSSVQKIQTWWRSQATATRRYTQYEKWSRRQADLIFGLILGHRVRNIIQSPEVKRTIFALGDVYKVLKGIITTAELVGGGYGSSSLSTSTSSLDLMAQVCCKIEKIKKRKEKQRRLRRDCVDCGMNYSDRLCNDKE
jgi:hypothetical protein